MAALRILLLPFSLIYGIVISVRNFLYNSGILKSSTFAKPVIVVGNLTVGGTGKTPHVETILSILESERIKFAVLSRGYGRYAPGLVNVSLEHTAMEVGDEPLQIKHKFKKGIVVVDGNRRRGLRHIFSKHPEVQVVVMDDGFQHRRVKPDLSFVLRDYHELDKRNFLLPAGTLREPSSSIRRADAVIITKTPGFFSAMEKRLLKERIQTYASQDVFFTYMQHGGMHSVVDDNHVMFDMEYYAERKYKVVCVTGIAQPLPFIEFLKSSFGEIEHMQFADHRRYTEPDIHKILQKYEKLDAENKIIITTEKDAMRLKAPELKDLLQTVPLFYIPVKVAFHHDDGKRFKAFILEHVRKTSKYGKLYTSSNGLHS